MVKPGLFVASVVVMCVAMFSGGADAREPLNQPLILVATPQLRGEPYAGSVLIVTPVGVGQHIGLIINRPTPMRLSQMFPDHEPSRKVTEPVFLGGPENLEMLFVLVQRQRNEDANAIALTPDLFLEMERKNVDHVIENEHERARFFAGVVVWAPGELQAEIANDFWYVLDADAALVMRKSTAGLWRELVKRGEQDRNAIKAGLPQGVQLALTR